MPVINKHLEKAERLLQKGKLDAALEEFLLARKEEPGNDAIVLEVADVYHRLNRVRECRQCYGYLFDKYAEKNDTSKAGEFFQKLQNLGPMEPKRLIAFAQVVEKQNSQKAIEYYKQALETASGQDPEASLQSLQGWAALQPTSIEVHQRMAELASKMARKALAASAYNKVGDLLVAGKKYPEAVDALEEAYRLSGGGGAAGLHLAKACSKAGRFPRVLEVLGQEGEHSGDSQVMGLIAEAYFAEKQLPEAERVYWKLAESSPGALDSLTEIAMEYLRQENISSALPLLKKLEEHLSAGKQQKGLIALAEKMSRIDHTNIAVLEFLSHLADHLNLDNPLSKALNGLFDLYFAAGEFPKATEALERLIDVDPYDPDSFAKLQRLEGKVEPATWKELAGRLGKTSTGAEAPMASAARPAAEGPSPDSGEGAGLGDLILQAEIFLQYKLEDKARERLQRIARLFPGEEEKNEELRTLFERANFNPRLTPAAPAAQPAPAAAKNMQSDWGRISEVIRNLSRQGTVKGVLSVAVNDIGRLWQASRCMVGLATPKRPPSMVLEYISPGVTPSDAVLLGKLVMGLQQIAEEQGSALVAESVSEAKQLAPLSGPLAALQVQSLVAIPLRDADQPAGILVLEECGKQRSWKAHDVAALETLAEQIVLAVSNARLRSLMKTLAVTDEHSGLLHRDSYLTCLLSEVERMRAQKTPLAAAILQFSGAKQQPHERQDEALEEFMRQFGSAFASHLRQNDIPLKYGPHSLVVIMPATTAKDAALMVEKMRRLAASFAPSGAGSPPPMAAGVAEAVREDEMDNVDIVTELINRVEWALDAAQANGGGNTKVLEPPTLPQ